MQLIGHAAVGITLARAVGATHPVAAFGVGWASHYLADFFPHGDEGVGAWAKQGNEVARFAGIFLIDGLVVLATFAVYGVSRGATWQDWHSWTPLLPAALATLGSFVPDLLWGFEKLIKRSLFPRLEKLHAANHNHLKIDLPFRYGMPLQLAVAALLWWWLIAAPVVAG